MSNIDFADPQDPNAPGQRSMADGFGQRMQGMFSGLSRGFQGGANALNPYSNRLLGFSAGMLGGGPSDAMKGLIAGSALDRESADRKKLNEAIAGLKGQSGVLSGLNEADWNYLSAAGPEAMSGAFAAGMKGPDYGDKYQGYQMAKAEGYEGSWMDYQREFKGDGGVNINLGDYKLPTGYRHSDPDDPSAGMERVEGYLTEKEINDLADARVRTRTIEDQLTRYEDLVGKYGMEAAPGEARAQISAVRQSIMLEMKELVGLGVLNGPDLELMNRMIWDPVVGDPRNLPDQIMTGVTGDPAVRAKSSADELRRFMKSKIDAYNQRVQGGGADAAADDDPLGVR